MRIMLCVYVLIISVRMTFSPPNIPIKQTFLTTFNNSVRSGILVLMNVYFLLYFSTMPIQYIWFNTIYGSKSAKKSMYTSLVINTLFMMYLSLHTTSVKVQKRIQNLFR